MAKKRSIINPASAVVSAYQTQNRARDFAGGLGDLLDPATQRNQALALKAEKEAKVAAKTSEINSWMSKLKSDLPLTGIDKQSQTALKNWLMSKKSQYAYATTQIANIQDQTSPEYIAYSDQLNEINNSISNLSDQIKAYKKNKLDFAEMNEKDMWSAGNDPESNTQAQIIYGLSDNPTPFTISQDGNLGFKIGDKEVSFNDYDPPFMKDYKTAKFITDQANTLFNAHTELSQQKISTLRLGLEEQLADPNALKSIISSDFTVNGLDFSNIVYNPDDIAGTRKQVIDAIITGYQDVAKEGIAEYNRKNPNSKKTNPGNVSDNDIYTNTSGAFKTLSELDKGYMAMTDIQNQFLSLPSDAPRDGLNTFVNVTPNIAFRYVPPGIRKNPETGEETYKDGYWIKMVRSGQASTFKPAKLPDGSAEMFTDLRNWYLTSTGQKK